jgi:hypothetical protein
MNIVQKIRASRLNRHGFIDVLTGVVAFQLIYITLLSNLSSSDVNTSGITPPSISFILFTGLIIAPLFENLLLIGVAAVHEKLLHRTGLFIVAPLLLTLIHFINVRHIQYPVVLRVLSLFFFFYLFLKQYDLHKLEIGKFKALLLSSVIHFAVNASGMLIVYLLEPDIDAETIFSAQPGE